jgi:hypothetical protein
MKKLIIALAFSCVAIGCSETPSAVVSASSVTEALKANALPIGAITVLDSATDSNKLLGRPNQYTSKTAFVDTRYLSSDETQQPENTIEVFANVEDATARQNYIAAVTKGVPMFTQYMFREGRILLRLQKDLLPEQAAQYEAALKASQ